MPMYVYTSRDGTVSVERFFSMASKPSRIKAQGRFCFPDLARTHAPVRSRHGDLWPRYSEAAGVHPDQVKEAIAADKKLGVPAEYDSEGRVKFDSPSHEKRWCEAHGMYQRNSYGTGRDADRDRANALAQMTDQDSRAKEFIDGN